MSRVAWRMSLAAALVLLAAGAPDAQTVPQSTQTYAVLIQKDKHGALTEESVQHLSHVMEELEEYGWLRVWVEASFNYEPLDPTDPGFAAQQRRLRRILQGIVANLDKVMDVIDADEEYPSLGPYVNVNADLDGARALIADRNVQAFFVLVPTY